MSCTFVIEQTTHAKATSLTRITIGSRMGLLSIEQGKAAYAADFALYGAAVAALAVALPLWGPPAWAAQFAALALAGLAGWTVIEYGLHRFVFHGLQPFAAWHAQHHQRPTARIATPTLLTVAMFAVLVFLPAFLMLGAWRAAALMLGVLAGYLFYAVTHHATHHWRGSSRWLRQRKRWHARHHQAHRPAECFGVTTSLWDRVLGSQRRP
jgi:cyclopropane-fatty-acyl-phospholipid synthase